MNENGGNGGGGERHAWIRRCIESLLLASGEPLSVGKILDVLDGPGRGEVVAVLAELAAEYERERRGFRLVEVAGGYQLRTAPENAGYVRRLVRQPPRRLSRAMLETLAVVAYRQPCTRAEVEAVRGVESEGVLTSLLERRLVRIVGRKEAPGRPLLYGTTREFLSVFGLPDLRAMPPLPEPGELTLVADAQVRIAAEGGETRADSETPAHAASSQAGGGSGRERVEDAPAPGSADGQPLEAARPPA